MRFSRRYFAVMKRELAVRLIAATLSRRLRLRAEAAKKDDVKTLIRMLLTTHVHLSESPALFAGEAN